MYGVLNLQKDPFVSSFDESLCWKTPELFDAEKVALRALRAGKSVWIHGRPGSGRSHFIRCLCNVLSEEGRPAILLDDDGQGSSSSLPARLFKMLGLSTDRDVNGEAVNLVLENIVDLFLRGGTMAFAPSTAPLPADELEEVAGFAALRLAGRPLMAFLLCGEVSPLDDVLSMHLPSFNEKEIRSVLVHRLEVCDAEGLIAHGKLDEIAAKAKGIGHAIFLARMELSRASFFRVVDDKEKLAGSHLGEVNKVRIFEPEQTEEAANLLEGL